VDNRIEDASNSIQNTFRRLRAATLTLNHAYSVARRTGEIGIRMAFGAQSGSVVWLVMREVLIVTAAGLAIGLPLAYSASHLVQSFLFGMTPKDPLTMGLAAGVLIAAAVAAGYGPARRASRISPMTALRQE
jgi:macrolide transport system ATP-binding/permease protein